MAFNSGYIVPLGLLKIFEIICLVISFATVEDQLISNIEGRGYVWNYYLAVTIIAFAFAIIWFLLNLCISFSYSTTFRFLVSSLHLILGVLIIVAGSILANLIRYFNEQHTIKAGVAFGLISAVILLIDAQLHLLVQPKAAPAEAPAKGVDGPAATV